jgi:hypothetical protein
VLIAKFEVVEALVTQQTPQSFFVVGGFVAKLAGEVAGCGGASAVFAVLWQFPPTPPHPELSSDGGYLFSAEGTAVGARRLRRFNARLPTGYGLFQRITACHVEAA